MKHLPEIILVSAVLGFNQLAMHEASQHVKREAETKCALESGDVQKAACNQVRWIEGSNRP